MQPLIQYQLVPDLKFIKRLIRHPFTSLFREGCEAGSAAHSWTEAAVTHMQLLGLCTGLPRWLSGKRVQLPMQAEKQETQFLSLDWKNPLEGEMTTHCSILAWLGKSHRQRSLAGCIHGVAKNWTWLSTQHTYCTGHVRMQEMNLKWTWTAFPQGCCHLHSCLL